MQLTVRVLRLVLALQTLLLMASALRISSENAETKARRYRDPLWRPCLRLCMNECGVYEGHDLMFCAENCIDTGFLSFSPYKYCFRFQSRASWRR